MKKRKAKAKKRKLVPRLGPATNLRPAGPHAEKRRKPRGEELRAALEDQSSLEPGSQR